MSIDRRTLTNQPDPPDYGKSAAKRIRTQIHRRIKASEPLADQWDAAAGNPPPDLRMPKSKMARHQGKRRKTHP